MHGQQNIKICDAKYE